MKHISDLNFKSGALLYYWCNPGMNLADPHPTKDNPQARVQTSKLPKKLIETLVPAVEKGWVPEIVTSTQVPVRIE